MGYLACEARGAVDGNEGQRYDKGILRCLQKSKESSLDSTVSTGRIYLGSV